MFSDFFINTSFLDTSFIDEYFISALLAGIIIASIPLLLASFGEMFSQEAGMLNLGIEGIMLAGAFISFYIAFVFNSYTLAFLGAGFIGIIFSLIIALFCIKFKINQIVVGIAITFFMQGFTALLHKISFSTFYPRLEKIEGINQPYLSDIPYIGQAFFNQPIFIIFIFITICIFSYFYNKSILKLHVKALGLKAKVLDISGINSQRLQILILIFTGLMASLAGAYLSLIASGIFIPFMTNGMGFIAVVLAMLARGRILYLFLISFVFGFCLSLGTVVQLLGSKLSSDFINMFPFIAILLMLKLSVK